MADKEENTEDLLKPVGPGVDEDSATTETSDDESVDEEARLGHSESDDDDDDDGDGSDSLSRKPYHEMNAAEKRQYRQDRKNRQRKARQRDQTELNFLRQRNEALERKFSQLETRTSQTEVLGIDQRISQLKSQITVADNIIAEAVENNSGKDMVEAQRIREEMLSNVQKLERMKEHLSSRTSTEETPPPKDETPKPSPELTRRASAFVSRHRWFKRGANEDSDIVSILDSRVMADGFDPTTDEYWDELEDRMRKRLPHRFKASKSDEETETPSTPTPKRKGGPTFSTSGREHRPLKKGEVFVNEERKKAMIEAGVWDDPILRNKFLKSYQKYDQENASRNRA